MDTEMRFFRDGQPMSLEEVNSEGGWRPPTYEISRALEHYRKHRKFPIPDLMKTKFLFYENDVGEVMTDEGMDIQMDQFTEVILYDLDGKELQSYQFQGLKKRMKLI